MCDFLLLVVEAYLNAEGIEHERDEYGALVFDLAIDEHRYAIRIAQTGNTLLLTAQWYGSIPLARIEEIVVLFERLIDAGVAGGKIGINQRRGLVKSGTSVDFSRATLTPERVPGVLNSLLAPFHHKVLAVSKVLDGEAEADDVVQDFAEVDRDRVADIMRKFVGMLQRNGYTDPSPN